MNFEIGIALLGFCALPAALFSGWQGPVPTESGLVAGTVAGQGDIRVFRGIPYAAPPVGALRWQAPKRPPTWTGIRPAEHFGPIEVQTLPAPGSFFQKEYFTGPPEPMSEDCLYLNIWTGAPAASARRPVMVWIHGGAGIRGSGSEPCFDGEALARKGVVVVTFNYRLNIFGWFAHPELSRESNHGVSGNYAELDQIAALRWVRRNIAAFGGDPVAVTVLGQSSGGSCINRLLIAPPARGLFQRAILESAGSLRDQDPSATLADMEKRGSAFAAQLGAHSLAELRAIPADRLLAASAHAGFGPNLDGWLLPELPAKIFARGGQAPVSILIGSNSDESRKGSLAAQYFAGARAKAALQIRLGQTAYRYYFDRTVPGSDHPGAFHGAETEYVFGTLGCTARPWEETDRKLSDLLSSYWTRFAATGNPNAPNLPVWPADSPDSALTMELGDRVGPRAVVVNSRN